MKLIKNGKIFDLAKATLIATSQIYMYYGNRQHKFYRSVNGIFFKTTICKSNSPDYNHPEEIAEILSLEKARDMFEYINSGKSYGSNHYDSFGYQVHVKYKDLFELVEG